MIWVVTMVSRFKRWLYEKFLPTWCKDDLMEANAALADQLDRVHRENERLQAYIDGMHAALRRCGRISIHTGEVRP